MSDNTTLPTLNDSDLLTNNRYVAITSAAFALQEVTLLSMTGVEQLGEPFHYELRIVSRRRIRSFTAVIGQPLTIGLKLADGGTRYFNGIVRQLTYVGVDDTRRPTYIVEVVPWLKLLEFRRNSRIFQNMTSLEIVKQIFADHTGTDFKDLTKTVPPRRVFCVQYDESDFAFVSRLLEQDGIYYYFVHAANRHEMILCDGATAHAPCDPQTVPTNLALVSHKIHEDVFWHWSENTSLQPGQIVLKDYDHEKPVAELTALAPVPAMKTGGVPTLDEDIAFDRLAHGPSGMQQAMTTPGPAAAQRELFFYPGRYIEKADGDFYAKIRSEEIGCRAYRVRITGGARQLCIGNTFLASNPFEITDTELAPQPTDSWFAVRAEIEIAGEPGYTKHREAPPAFTPYPDAPSQTVALPQASSGREEAYLYRCTIEAQPSANPFRPKLRTPRPVIAGPQTAVVVGRPGETITTDQYGRIKVQFFWDQLGKKDENSSCWIRVAQSWAGKGYGALVTPRLGQEVVVEFICGNPDWPLVTGVLYNAINMPPADLPSQAPRSTMKTRSVDGAAAEFNEFRLDDTRGSEEVYLKAQRDWTVEVGNDYNIAIDREYTMTLPGALAGAAPSLQQPGTLGSTITATPEKISFVVSGPTGKQAMEITTEGVFVIGTNVGLLAVGGKVTSTPVPLPVPSPQLLKVALELEAPVSDDLMGLPEPPGEDI
jgi:type VI secretion system secreted protein VgrG